MGADAARRMRKLTTADLAISDVTLSELARIIRDPKKDAFVKTGRLAWLTAFSSGFTVVPVAAAFADRAAYFHSLIATPATGISSRPPTFWAFRLSPWTAR